MSRAPTTLLELLLRAAEERPDAIAVRSEASSRSYAETARAATGIGSTLHELGIEPGARVGISLPKGVEMLAAVYGVMAAGAAYVPLDPGAPPPRRAAVARDCALDAVIATPNLATELVDELGEGAPEVVVLVGAEVPRARAGRWITFDEAAAGEAGRSAGPRGQDLAYILYTSGSTGVPKGVMLTHANALAFVSWAAGSIGTAPDDVFSNHAPLHFDLSVFDLYVAAWGGASVCPVPEEIVALPGSLAAFARSEGITVWYSVPSALSRLVRGLPSPGALPFLRAAVFAGEVYPTPQLRELRRMVPDAALWNLYGPTETNVVTAHRVAELPPDEVSIPIGAAVSDAVLTVRLEDGTPARVGDEGELIVSGPSVMRGYWGAPERTADVLAPDPTTGEPAYRTGDIVRVRADGELDFVGRRDHQVKVRGYRIELGDVEAALVSDPAVSEAVVVVVPNETWGAELVAFVVPRLGADVSAGGVRRRLADRLPRYMIPSTVHVVEEIDRTSTGKADRASLVGRSQAASAP